MTKEALEDEIIPVPRHPRHIASETGRSSWRRGHHRSRHSSNQLQQAAKPPRQYKGAQGKPNKRRSAFIENSLKTKDLRSNEKTELCRTRGPSLILSHIMLSCYCGAHIIPAYQPNSTIRFQLKEKLVFLKTGWEQQNQQGEVLPKFFFQKTIHMKRPVCQYHETGAQNSVCHIDDRSLPWS